MAIWRKGRKEKRINRDSTKLFIDFMFPMFYPNILKLLSAVSRSHLEDTGAS